MCASSQGSATALAAGKVRHIVTRCDGDAVQRALATGAERLAAAVDEVNALNVYPVPDGDTGTNMLHTIRSALEHAQGSVDRSVAAVSAAAAHGALMGARGNSGVILSQILRGLKDALASGEVDLRAAFGHASAHASAAVTAPAPGTILSALAEIEAVVRRGGGGAADVLRAAVDAGRGAVDRTRHDNPTNRAAGVVDAGARGLWILLDGALGALEAGPQSGRRASVRRPADAPATRLSPVPSPAVAAWAGAYDVQLLISEASRSVAELREAMLEFGGDCVLVVGDGSVCRVHVHTRYPDKVIGIAVAAGRISDVVVEDLELMSAEHEAATGIVVPMPGRTSGALLGVVAVVPGDGLASVVTSLGGHPVRGGASMNPSTEELLAAINAVNAPEVVVLPNDKNVILAARSAAALAPCAVTVLPLSNIGGGMAALLAFDPGRPAAETIAAMTEAAARAHAIEITRATRSVTVDGVAVRESETIGLVDGRVVAHGDDEAAVLGEAAATLEAVGIFTVYVGSGVEPERVTGARAGLAQAFPDAEIEIIAGGQPHYPFVIAAE